MATTKPEFSVLPVDVIGSSEQAIDLCQLLILCARQPAIKSELETLMDSLNKYALKASELVAPVTLFEQYELFSNLNTIQEIVTMLTRMIEKK